MITEFPSKRFMVTPAFQIKEVSVTGEYRGWSVKDYYTLESGKAVHESDLHESKEAAAAWAQEKLTADQEKLTKSQEKLNKRIQNFKKWQPK